MTFISIILASATMSLGLVGPGAGHACGDDCAKACCATAEEAPSCAMCEKMEDGEKCAMCAAHADAKDAMADHATCASCEALGEGKMCASCAAHADMGGKMDGKMDHANMGHQGHADHAGHGKAHAATPKVDSALYGNAAWPAHNTAQRLGAKSFQGKQLPVAIGNESWISEKVNLEGKVIVIDFWATWCGPCRKASPMLDKLQVEHKGNLEVLAISGLNDPESDVRSYVAEHKVAYSHLYDGKQGISSKMEVRSIPHTVIMSTDGVIRWQGNPLSAEFKKALEQVLAVDPVINAKG